MIGCGQLGFVHARRFAAMSDVEVTAVSDPSREAMERAAAALPAPPRMESDYREILDTGLDAVCVASPDAYHVPQVLDSLAANLHVLCEKPLTLALDDVEAVVASRDEVGRHVAMTYPRRYDGGSRAVRREIQSGRWGRVKTIAAYNAEDWVTPNRGTWRHDPAICPGGFFYDANGHQIDYALWVSGLQPVSVSAQIENRATPIPLVIWGSARLTDNVPMAFTFVGDAHKWREQVNIHCEGMDFALENGKAFWIRDGKVEPIEPREPDETADSAFINLIRGEGPNWAPPDDVRPVVEFTRKGLGME